MGYHWDGCDFHGGYGATRIVTWIFLNGEKSPTYLSRIVIHYSMSRFYPHYYPIITSSTSISVGSIFHFFTHTAYTSHSLLVKDSILLVKFSFGAPSCGISPDDWQIPTGTNRYFQLVIISEFYDGKIETGKPYIYGMFFKYPDIYHDYPRYYPQSYPLVIPSWYLARSFILLAPPSWVNWPRYCWFMWSLLYVTLLYH